MNLSANSLKWLMRFYPPLFFNRIWVCSISTDFRHARVKVFRSVLNRNFNSSIFGGTIFTASDPFYALMIWGILRRKGYKVTVWMKSASIQFLKPALSNLTMQFEIGDSEAQEAETILNEAGKYIHKFSLDVKNVTGEICATIQNEVYARKLDQPF